MPPLGREPRDATATTATSATTAAPITAVRRPDPLPRGALASMPDETRVVDRTIGRVPRVMGILNVTPDSFSDGGAYASSAEAAATARLMFEDGAAFVDVGGESTRPGAETSPQDEELRRVVPVLELLSGCPVSVDTSRAEVARRALALGATMVNDVSALRREPELAQVRRRGRRTSLPDAHAGRASHDAGRAALPGRRLRGGRRFSRSGSPSRSPQVSRRSGSASIPASASGRRPTTTWSSSGGSTASSRSGVRCSSGSRASRRWPGSSGPRTARLGTDCCVGRGRSRGLRPGCEPLPRPRRTLARRGPRGRCRSGAGYGRAVTIELRGIELHAFHGVLEHERRDGQRFLVDVELDLADTTAAGDATGSRTRSTTATSSPP